MSDFGIGFDAASQSALGSLANTDDLIKSTTDNAAKQIANAIVDQAKSNMNWKAGSGELFDSMQVFEISPTEFLAGSALPYARRRDQGFFGTDSLGRTYHDLGSFYFTDAIITVMKTAADDFATVISNSIKSIFPS